MDAETRARFIAEAQGDTVRCFSHTSGEQWAERWLDLDAALTTAESALENLRFVGDARDDLVADLRREKAAAERERDAMRPVVEAAVAYERARKAYYTPECDIHGKALIDGDVRRATLQRLAEAEEAAVAAYEAAL